MSQSCDNCLLRINGSCSVPTGICSEYKPTAKVSTNEINMWPSVMRSSSLYDVSEKRKYERTYNKSNKPNLQKDNTEIKNEILNKKRSVKSALKDKLYESVAEVQEDYKDWIIIWIYGSRSDTSKYQYLYRLEYNKNGVGCQYIVNTLDAKTITDVVIQAINRIIKTDYKILIVSTTDIKRMSEYDNVSYRQIIDALSKKTKEYKFIYARLFSKSVKEHIKKWS